MRNTRVMTWIFLGLSAAFFCLRDFRGALQLATMQADVARVQTNDYNGWMNRVRGWGPTQEQVRALGERAQTARDAQALAFVAVHLDDATGAFDAADAAFQIDPGTAWIGHYLLSKFPAPTGLGNRPERVWMRVAAADPGNAVPWIVRANMIARSKANFPQVQIHSATDIDASGLALEKDWLDAMQTAFRQPHATWPSTKLFLLERAVMQKEGWDRPTTYLGTTMLDTVPNLQNVRDYANYKVFYLAAQAEKAHKMDEALRQCRETAEFGQKMVHEGGDNLPRLIGLAVHMIGGQEWANKLDRAGKKEEAASVRAGVLQVRDTLDLSQHYWSSRNESNIGWARELFPVLAALIAIFAGASLLAVTYVNVICRMRPDARGLIYRVTTVSENYFPILLFAACLGLFVLDLPYANNFRFYMTVADPGPYRDSAQNGIFPLSGPFTEPGLALHSSLLAYLYTAGALLAVIFVIAALTRERSPQQRAARAVGGR